MIEHIYLLNKDMQSVNVMLWHNGGLTLLYHCS